MGKDIEKLAKIGELRLRGDVVEAMRDVKEIFRERKLREFKSNVFFYKQAIRILEVCGIDGSEYTRRLKNDLKSNESYLKIFQQMIGE